jgi:two-component system, NarL family, nitrate/nitrite response regulator NarL
VALRCLIVDDNEQFLVSASRLLESQGLEIAGTASTSAEAAELVTRLRPDILLVDVQLGDEDGLQLARRLAATSAGRVIMISTHGEAELADLWESTGAVGFLHKTALSARAVRALADQDFE